MNSKIKDADVRDEKLEDILRSIKGIIYNHKHSANAVSKEDNHADLDESILELTTEVEEDELLSKDTANRFSTAVKDFTKKLDDDSLNQPENNVDTAITNLIKPMLKDWLDNNLPRLVEKIIAEELKKLIQKK